MKNTKILIVFTLFLFFITKTTINLEAVENKKITQDTTEEEKTEVPDAGKQLYKDAIQLAETGKFNAAIQKLESIKSMYPYTVLSRAAIFKLIEIYTEQSEYRKAAWEINALIADYTVDFIIEKLEYNNINLNYKELQNRLQDQSWIVKVIKIMEAFLITFPESDYAPDVQQKLQLLNEKATLIEIKGADDYIKKRNYIAALKKYKSIYNSIDKKNSYMPEVLYKIYFCYSMIGLQNEALEFLSELGISYHESKWYKAATNIKPFG
jgi:outer membrane protein assembly factor BamD